MKRKLLSAHTDRKSWREAFRVPVAYGLVSLVAIFTPLSDEEPLLLFWLLFLGVQVGFIVFHLANKPAKIAPVGRYWIFVKDPSKVGVYGPYTKSDAASQVTEFNESYPETLKAGFVKAESREEAQLAARELRK